MQFGPGSLVSTAPVGNEPDLSSTNFRALDQSSGVRATQRIQSSRARRKWSLPPWSSERTYHLDRGREILALDVKPNHQDFLAHSSRHTLSQLWSILFGRKDMHRSPNAGFAVAVDAEGSVSCHTE